MFEPILMIQLKAYIFVKFSSLTPLSSKLCRTLHSSNTDKEFPTKSSNANRYTGKEFPINLSGEFLACVAVYIATIHSHLGLSG
jgi:hypothetical protein